jgi:hypothetical protein
MSSSLDASDEVVLGHDLDVLSLALQGDGVGGLARGGSSRGEHRWVEVADDQDENPFLSENR